MIHRRQFIYEEDAMGQVGFMPLWIPESANYGSLLEARMFLHDSFEHALTDKGTIANEITAYGRILPFRIANATVSRVQFAADLGQELGIMMWSIYEQRGENGYRPVKYSTSRLSKQRVSDEGYAKLIRKVAESFADCITKNDRDQKVQRHYGFDFESDMIDYCEGWLKLGFFDMHRKMGDLASVESIGAGLFDPVFVERLQREIDEAKEYCVEGSAITITFDTTVSHDPEFRIRLHRNQYADWLRRARYLRAQH